MALFRKEALERHGVRLHGQIRLGVPLSWHAIGYTLFAAVLIAFIFLSLASYARVETVQGTIILNRGTAPITASRPGVIRAIRVSDNQIVQAGEPLAEISAEEVLYSGGSTPKLILDALRRQRSELSDQREQSGRAASAEEARLREEMSGLTQELRSIDQQISVQRDLVASAANEVSLIQDVAKKGYISRRDVLVREETLLTRRQQLEQLSQTRVVRFAALMGDQRNISQIRAQAAAQAAAMLSSSADLDQKRAEAEAREGYVLSAPFRGRVTALTARLGQAVQSGQALMTLVPTNATLAAELYVPPRASGFLRPGQEARLAIDAFPYQQFGTMVARIDHVSGATVLRQDAAGNAVPVYLVSAILAEPSMRAFGETRPLTPGMTVSARIITQRQSLYQWLFQPLLAVRNR